MRAQRRRWRFGPFWYQAYALGFFLLIVWMMLNSAFPRTEWLLGLLVVAFGIYTIGFISWFRPVVKKAIRTPWGTWAFAITHALLLILSVAVARIMVFDALRMPPQYFDVTVSLVALATYIPVVLSSSIVLMLLFIVVGIPMATGGKLVANVLQSWSTTPMMRSSSLRRLRNRTKRFSDRLFAHGIAMALTIMVCALALDGISLGLRQALWGVRWFAYYADFHPAGTYPGVPCGKRVRLQDNGVVAVATISGNDITFEAVRFDEKSSKNCITNQVE